MATSSNMDKIKAAAAADGFTPDQVDALVNMGAKLSGDAIKKYLLILCDENLTTNNVNDIEQLKNMINNLSVPVIGHMNIEVRGLTDRTLCLQVGIVPADYQFDLHVPKGWSRSKCEEMLTGILHRMDKLAELTNETYKHLMSQNIQLFTLMCNVMKKIDFSVLRINENNRTLAFSEQSSKRIGIIVYYERNGVVLEDGF